MSTIISNSLSQLSIAELNEQLTKIHTVCLQILASPKHGDKDMILLFLYRHEVGDVTLELEKRISTSIDDYCISEMRSRKTTLRQIHLTHSNAFRIRERLNGYRFRPYIRLHAHESTFYPADPSVNETPLDPTLWTG
ncbi:hypothetical protein DFH28DRAFT_1194552 [Melampsora americana]|nr:hypothetical protein DFH28DRAFT_1194552 [Melampsora americana]